MAHIAGLVSEIKSSAGWIGPLSFAAVLFGRLTFVPPNEKPKPSPQRLANARTRKREAVIREEKVHPPEKIKEQEESLLMKLPVEIRLLILEFCLPTPSERRGVNSMETFLALLQVSKTIHCEAYVACLPHIPIALWTKRGVGSFHSLLRRKPELGCLVRYLWIGTGRYDEEELAWATRIIKSANQLQSLACTESLLSRVAKQGALSETCKRLTLMNMEKQAEYEVKEITQLRLCAGILSNEIKFPNVTSLSVNVRRRNSGKEEKPPREECSAVEKWVEAFANLRNIALVGKDSQGQLQVGLRGKPVRQNGKPDVFSVTIPARWTEWDIWSTEVWGCGVWSCCNMPSAK